MTTPTDPTPDVIDQVLLALGHDANAKRDLVVLSARPSDDEIADLLRDTASDRAANGDDGAVPEGPDPYQAAGDAVNRWLRSGFDHFDLKRRVQLEDDAWALGEVIFQGQGLDMLDPADGHAAVDVQHVVDAVRAMQRTLRRLDARA